MVMGKKQFKPSKLTLFFSLFVFGLILLLLPSRFTSRINLAFIDIFSFFFNVTSSAQSFSALGSGSGEYVSRHEHNRLWVAYQNLQAQLSEERQRVEKLGHLRITEPNPNTSLVLAEIVNIQNNEIVLNRGSADGLRIGQYVLGDNAVIGVISMVSSSISRAKIITGKHCEVDIKICVPESNSYINWTMRGDGRNHAKISNLPKRYTISEGCNVYAAKKAGLLESPRIIGKVSKCIIDETNPVVWDITVDPAYNLGNITDVAVIVMNTGAI